ncbi:hypothetical protein BDV23DRAFT_181355 [Aspergillus alliaceus]|uniref:Uncharacterized protein n=1 Tax=Petromyces alliaceus TaxID=209559 RepID=A0A5N6FXP8_PETAA|nr:uncharacterized protein BDW43DRAFT_51843 [Aspergillus alliaceus]KAB8234692.1 hypothetical protein BDW43DRAFT_51843 [Aspergillus alliaceus]KAE8392668.1 hypothetical protein BDV23DRAFT_181355 [Aspergillus alliaceus]
MNRPPRLSFLFLFSLVLPVVYSESTCYWPDGTPATADVPCSDEKYAPCCRAGNLCLSNNLCLNVAIQPYVLSRGACTDPNWNSDNCPQFCTNVSRGSGSSLFPLGLNSNGLAEYCCNEPILNGSKIGCAASSGSSFFVPDGSLVAGYAALANISSLSASNSTSGNSAPGNGTSSSSPSSRDAAIGAGVGVPLGVIAIGAVAWALYERRSRRESLAAAARFENDGGVGGIPVYGMQQHEMEQWKNPSSPVELTTSSRTHELPS